jgi:cation:H+ antiporter
MTGAVALVAGGLVLLTLAADRLVLSAARLSRLWGMSAVLIGALVIGMGTSLPEFLVSSLAAARGEMDLAMGNIIGSNVANLSLVLGVSVIILPVAGHLHTIRREGILMLAAVVAFGIAAWGGAIMRLEAWMLLVGVALSAWLLVRWSHQDIAEGIVTIDVDDLAPPGRGAAVEIVIGVLALGVTLGGADLLLRGARIVASELGLSQGFIGLSLVAVGTSLPELATGIAAARRRENALVIGNVLGSNLFNSLGVAGTAALAGGTFTTDFRAPIVFMIAISTLAGILTATGNRLVRWEGAILVAAFAGFLTLGIR